ncbi:MAG: hypothetical protein ACREYA_31225 [Cupriavidus necator]
MILVDQPAPDNVACIGRRDVGEHELSHRGVRPSGTGQQVAVYPPAIGKRRNDAVIFLFHAGQPRPTLAVEQDGKLSRLPLGRYFGKPELFRKALADLLAPAQAAQ